jgi:hypothetical protein
LGDFFHKRIWSPWASEAAASRTGLDKEDLELNSLIHSSIHENPFKNEIEEPQCETPEKKGS